MENNIIKLKGVIKFDPIEKTAKHIKQSSWKKVAMVVLYGDLCEYYSWFFKKRFNLTLEKPLRESHVTFINDAEFEMNGKWEEVKKKWDGKEVDIYLSLLPDTNSLTREEIEDHKNGVPIDLHKKHKQELHWWLIVPHDKRLELQEIRKELGLDKPYFGMHASIGRVLDARPLEDLNKHTTDSNAAMVIKEMRYFHSRYIHLLMIDNLI